MLFYITEHKFIYFIEIYSSLGKNSIAEKGVSTHNTLPATGISFNLAFVQILWKRAIDRAKAKVLVHVYIPIRTSRVNMSSFHTLSLSNCPTINWSLRSAVFSVSHSLFSFYACVKRSYICDIYARPLWFCASVVRARLEAWNYFLLRVAPSGTKDRLQREKTCLYTYIYIYREIEREGERERERERERHSWRHGSSGGSTTASVAY